MRLSMLLTHLFASLRKGGITTTAPSAPTRLICDSLPFFSVTPRLRGKNRETTRIFAGFIRFEQIKRMIGANDNLNESSNAAMSNLPWLRHLIRNALLTLQRQR